MLMTCATVSADYDGLETDLLKEPKISLYIPTIKDEMGLYHLNCSDTALPSFLTHLEENDYKIIKICFDCKLNRYSKDAWIIYYVRADEPPLPDDDMGFSRWR